MKTQNEKITFYHNKKNDDYFAVIGGIERGDERPL